MSLRAVFLDQAGHCDALGSPFTARLLTQLSTLIEPGTPLMDRLLAWPGDTGPKGASLPLRLAGALHSLVRMQVAPELLAAYPPHTVSDAALKAAVTRALTDHADHINQWMNEAPQTNEVRRSAALIAVGHWLTARYGLPITLSELGASGGLNLMWDRFGLTLEDQTYGPGDVLSLTPDWSGPLPPVSPPVVAARRGVDLNPLDPRTDEGQLRLLSYLWPDQTDRIARTRAALQVADATVDQGDAAGWAEARVAQPRPGQLHMLYHTIAFQYFPKATQDRIRAAMEAAGARATDDAPLAWFSMEADDQARGAALTLRLWPGTLTLNMGRADFHGRWVDWTAPDPKTPEPPT